MKKLTQYIDEALIKKTTKINKIFQYLNKKDFVKKYKLRRNHAKSYHQWFKHIGYDVNKDIINMFEKLKKLDNSILDESINYIMPKFNLRENWKLSYDYYDNYYDNYLEFKLDSDGVLHSGGVLHPGGVSLGIFSIEKNSLDNNIDSEIIYYWKDENHGYMQRLTSEEIKEIEKAIFTWIDYLLNL